MPLPLPELAVVNLRRRMIWYDTRIHNNKETRTTRAFHKVKVTGREEVTPEQCTAHRFVSSVLMTSTCSRTASISGTGPPGTGTPPHFFFSHRRVTVHHFPSAVRSTESRVALVSGANRRTAALCLGRVGRPRAGPVLTLDNAAFRKYCFFTRILPFRQDQITVVTAVSLYACHFVQLFYTLLYRIVNTVRP